jgi:hypothetical protein
MQDKEPHPLTAMALALHKAQEQALQRASCKDTLRIKVPMILLFGQKLVLSISCNGVVLGVKGFQVGISNVLP